MSEPCPCGSDETYADCCEPLHAGEAAADAEALMRSRYSAFVRLNRDYLLKSWAAETRPIQFDTDASVRWLGLKIVDKATLDNDHAEVEFVARFHDGRRAHRLHERSRFRREGEHWIYVDGVQVSKPKPNHRRKR